jgi:hypothetical protein
MDQHTDRVVYRLALQLKICYLNAFLYNYLSIAWHALNCSYLGYRSLDILNFLRPVPPCIRHRLLLPINRYELYFKEPCMLLCVSVGIIKEPCIFRCVCLLVVSISLWFQCLPKHWAQDFNYYWLSYYVTLTHFLGYCLIFQCSITFSLKHCFCRQFSLCMIVWALNIW